MRTFLTFLLCLGLCACGGGRYGGGIPAAYDPLLDAALADCYTAAGPARCRQALMECLPLPEDTRYLALSEAVLERITARYGPVRVGFSGAMTAGELARYGRDSRVQGLSAAEAHGFLTGMDADAVVPQPTPSRMQSTTGPRRGARCVMLSSARTSTCCPGPCRRHCGR